MKLNNHLFRVLAFGFCLYLGVSFITTDVAINQVYALDQGTQDMIDHLEQLLETTGSYRADVTSIFEGGKEIQGKFKFMWPNLRWQENQFPRNHGRFYTFYIISNGTIRWNYSPGLNWARKYNKEVLNEDAQQKGWLSAAMIDGTSLQYEGKENFGGVEVYVFDVEPSALLKHENPDPPGKTRFYVGAKDGIFRKIITYNPQGRETGSQTYTNIQLDDTIAAKDFEFTPPEDTQIQVVDDVGSRINPNK